MLELRTLGTLDLRMRDGPELRSIVSQPKRTALLFYLALARPHGFHRRDKLLALFWPETDTEHARGSLRQAVRFLRRSLGEDVILSRGDEELAVAAGVLECDAVAFEQALAAGEPERALALYGGDLLPGFYVDGAPEFERWLEAERTRLREQAAVGAWTAADASERAGDRLGAAAWGRRAAAMAPADDTALRRLIQLLDRTGDPDGALRAYHEGVRRLRVEYEIEPSPETHELGEGICERVRAAAAAIVAAAPPSPAVPAKPQRPSTVVARRRWWVAAALATVVLGATAWTVVRARRTPAYPQAVVVTPFENRTGDASLAPLGEMASDWIAQGLTANQIAEVVNGSPARPVAHRGRPGGAAPDDDQVRRLSRATGAGLVVTGRYYRSADSIAFVARVADARSGKLLAVAGPILVAGNAPVAGADRLRQKVLAQVAGLIDTRLNGRPLLQVPPPSYEAYREFIEGLHCQWRDAFREADAHFSRAFALDTTFYPALVKAAGSALMTGALGRYDSLFARLEQLRDRLSPGDRQLVDGQRALRTFDYRAMYAVARRGAGGRRGRGGWGLALSAGRVHRYRESLAVLRRLQDDAAFERPKYFEAFLAGAQHAMGDLRGEIRSAAEMARRAPESPVPDALRLSALAALGRAPEARAVAVALAARLHGDSAALQDLARVETLGFPAPTAAVSYFLGARELAAHGHASDGLALAEEGLRWCAGRPAAEQAEPAFRWVKAHLLGITGRWREAEAVLPATPPSDWTSSVQWLRATIAARLGDRARALEIAGGLEPSARPGVEPQRIMIAAASGEREEVRRRLREMLARGGFYGEWWVHTEPLLAPYLAEPEIRGLLRADG